jgi:hypothetical protein
MQPAPWQIPVAARETEAVTTGVREIGRHRQKFYKRFQEDKTLRLPGSERKAALCPPVPELAAEDEHVAAERIGADDLLCLRRQAVEAGAQIDRLASEKDLRSRRRGQSSGPPQCRQDPLQRLFVEATIDAHPNPVR